MRKKLLNKRKLERIHSVMKGTIIRHLLIIAIPLESKIHLKIMNLREEHFMGGTNLMNIIIIQDKGIH